jgi:hypothetical protein
MTLSSSNDTMSVTDVAGPATEHQPAFTMLSSIPPKRRASVAQTHALHTPRTYSRPRPRRLIADRSRAAHQAAQYLIQKFNSTSSLYIKDTLQSPDLDEITWWYAITVAPSARLTAS